MRRMQKCPSFLWSRLARPKLPSFWNACHSSFETPPPPLPASILDWKANLHPPENKTNVDKWFRDIFLPCHLSQDVHCKGCRCRWFLRRSSKPAVYYSNCKHILRFPESKEKAHFSQLKSHLDFGCIRQSGLHLRKKHGMVLSLERHKSIQFPYPVQVPDIAADEAASQELSSWKKR